MNNEIKELIKYRINRAEESLEEAAILFDSGHYNTSSHLKVYLSEA